MAMENQQMLRKGFDYGHNILFIPCSTNPSNIYAAFTEKLVDGRYTLRIAIGIIM